MRSEAVQPLIRVEFVQFLLVRHHPTKPVIDTSWCSVQAGVWAVDADSSSSQAKQAGLLGIGKGDGLETSKDDRMVDESYLDVFGAGQHFVAYFGGEVDG